MTNNIENEIKSIPSSDPFPITATIYANKRFNKHELGLNCLTLTVLDLIMKNQIKCEISWNETHTAGKKITKEDLEVMKNITLRIANKGELKTSETLAINLLKRLNKNKKFTLKDMLNQGKTTPIANKFKEDFMEFKKAIENENEYTSKNYKDILINGKFSDKAKEIKNKWKQYQKYLKSSELSKKYPPEDMGENALQIIYGACFDIEKETLKSRKNDSALTDLIDKDGYKLLNIIFKNILSNASEKRKGDGIFYGVNDKYTIPGGG